MHMFSRLESKPRNVCITSHGRSANLQFQLKTDCQLVSA